MKNFVWNRSPTIAENRKPSAGIFKRPPGMSEDEITTKAARLLDELEEIGDELKLVCRNYKALDPSMVREAEKDISSRIQFRTSQLIKLVGHSVAVVLLKDIDYLNVTVKKQRKPSRLAKLKARRLSSQLAKMIKSAPLERGVTNINIPMPNVVIPEYDEIVTVVGRDKEGRITRIRKRKELK